MDKSKIYSGNFLLHVKERLGYEGLVLFKEPASRQPSSNILTHLHNEYTFTTRLAGVNGVRNAWAKEGSESGPVLLLQYVAGQSLSELIVTTDPDLEEKIRLAVNVTKVLSRVHDCQVIHNDLCSSNIIVADSESLGSEAGVYLIDFGHASSITGESSARRPVDNALIDNMSYISPEQTGKLNRQTDHRADLYSLGVILYQLFTGQLPFCSDDVLELIHEHIARLPELPHQVKTGIPITLSDIILKLMAKDADDRYQTAGGLLADLERCLDQWLKRGQIEPFELAKEDFTGRLQVPRKLYGRQAEMERLQDVYGLAVNEQPQLLMVSGYSGVGKTSLVRELQSDIAEQGSDFGEGKFDQFSRTQPYSAWEQSISGLVDQWLARSQTQLAIFRERILASLGDQAQVLIDIIPSLAQILGQQPDVPQLDGIENQRRVNFMFGRLFDCLAVSGQPLVIFLDDMQWIDQASLGLLEALVIDQGTRCLMIVGAFRNNEVEADHPLAISLGQMEALTSNVTVLELEDLPPEVLNQILADSLQLGVSDCRDLGRVLIEKSAGNPFFFRQLLYEMEEDELLRFDRDRRLWTWGDGLGKRLQACGSVVDLLVAKIRTLPDDTHRALSIAACIGSDFNLSTLETIIGRSQADILTVLKPALLAGLILRSDDHFWFTHDRVQEAGYALIPESDQPQFRLAIGRSLSEGMKYADLEQKIFSVVDHLNAGRALIDEASEKTEMAALNLRAGKRAKTASAYLDARKYIEIGMEFLGSDSWQEEYELSLLLHNEDAELAYLTGQYDQVEKTATIIHTNAENVLDRVSVYMTQTEAATAESRFVEALDIGLAALKELGVGIPEQPTPEDGRRLHETFTGLLTTEPMERLKQLPQMSDERAIAVSALLASVMSTAYIAKPQLFPIISYHGAILTVEFGVDAWSPFFVGGVVLVNMASITPEGLNDAAQSQVQFGGLLVKIIRALVENPITAKGKTKGLFMLSFAAPWFEKHEDSIALCRATYDSGRETGDWLYGAYGASLFASQSLAAGLKLAGYLDQVTAFSEDTERLGQVMNSTSFAIHLQTVENFLQASPDPHRLRGGYFNEDEWLSQAVAANDVSNRHYLTVSKLILAYHYDCDDALDNTMAMAEKYLIGGPGLMSVAQFYLYQALAKLRQIGDGNAPRHSDSMDLVDKNLHWMRLWSTTTPSTFEHKHDLMTAERARVTGDLEAALTLYERAIEGARKSGFTHEEALANELFARFWVDRGHDRFAVPLMHEAHSLYLKWGAAAKAKHLSRHYPEILTGSDILVGRLDSSVILHETPGALDVRTVLKASQNIAGEIELDSLLTRLMTDVIETSGAQKGFLLLETAGHWTVEAKVSLVDYDKRITLGEDIAGSDFLAEGIVHYVDSKHETVVLEEASKSGKFTGHEYLRNHPVKSLFCMPLINRGKTSAILYLENNLAAGVFSPERVALLNLLSSQMAISIDNARVHANLDRLLKTRSKALASAEAQVRTLFENSPLGVGLVKPGGQMLSFNQSLINMLGVSDLDLSKINMIDFYVDPKDRAAMLMQVEKSGYVQEFGIRLVRPDGSKFDANLSMSKLVLEGNEVLLGMLQDVTAQITAEQETAVHEERARMARELHDAVTQTILSASLLADATVQTSKSGEEVEPHDLNRLARTLHGALDEMRTLLLDMRPAAAQNRTLGQILNAMVESVRNRSPAKVSLRVEGDSFLPANVTAQLQRIAQESLNNAIWHAEATAIEIELAHQTEEGITMSVSDNGCGFDTVNVQTGHHGLEIMTERANEIGAVLKLTSEPGAGTRVSVIWS